MLFYSYGFYFVGETDKFYDLQETLIYNDVGSFSFKLPYIPKEYPWLELDIIAFDPILNFYGFVTSIEYDLSENMEILVSGKTPEVLLDWRVSPMRGPTYTSTMGAAIQGITEDCWHTTDLAYPGFTANAYYFSGNYTIKCGAVKCIDAIKELCSAHKGHFWVLKDASNNSFRLEVVYQPSYVSSPTVLVTSQLEVQERRYFLTSENRCNGYRSIYGSGTPYLNYYSDNAYAMRFNCDNAEYPNYDGKTIEQCQVDWAAASTADKVEYELVAVDRAFASSLKIGDPVTIIDSDLGVRFTDYHVQEITYIREDNGYTTLYTFSKKPW